jgi:hypothetical protein
LVTQLSSVLHFHHRYRRAVLYLHCVGVEIQFGEDACYQVVAAGDFEQDRDEPTQIIDPWLRLPLDAQAGTHPQGWTVADVADSHADQRRAVWRAKDLRSGDLDVRLH